MLLTIDCGNTNTVFSIWDGKEFLATWRTSTEWQRTADQYFVWLTTLMNARKLDIEIDEDRIGCAGVTPHCGHAATNCRQCSCPAASPSRALRVSAISSW